MATADGWTCPKRMVYGPCGGVRPDGACEVDDRPCPFVTTPAPPWTGPTAHARAIERPVATGPFVVCDFRAPTPHLHSVARLARAFTGRCDALLVGEHQDRPDLPALLVAQAIQSEGGRPWVTVACRDRNRAVIEADLHGLAEIGVLGVHCVTGDARAPYLRPGVTQVFDLDSVRLTDLATRMGLSVSVAESPAAPPAAGRVDRTVTKHRAGARVCFVNHCGGPQGVEQFVTAAIAAGAAMLYVPCVPVFVDRAAADALTSMPGVSIDPDQIAAVLEASDPVDAGVRAAIATARRMLAIDGVEGVNLSGPGSGSDVLRRAEIMTAIADELRAA